MTFRDGREGTSSYCGHRGCRSDCLQPPLSGWSALFELSAITFRWLPAMSLEKTSHLSFTCLTSRWPWALLEELLWSSRTAPCPSSGFPLREAICE